MTQWTSFVAVSETVVNPNPGSARDADVPLAPMVEGVRQEVLEGLERTLRALLNEYEAGDAARRVAVRRLVIEAKDHAKLAARKNPAKQEMILWMLTWLENPPLFPAWLKLRKTNS